VVPRCAVRRLGGAPTPRDRPRRNAGAPVGPPDRCGAVVAAPAGQAIVPDAAPHIFWDERDGVPPLPNPSRPLDVEVVPLWFEVALCVQIPEVRVWVQVVNYLSSDLQLRDVTATYCHINEGPPLENIPGGEHRILARRSWQVMCRRILVDAETRALLKVRWRDQFEGILHVRIRGEAGDRTIASTSAPSTFAGGLTACLRTHWRTKHHERKAFCHARRGNPSPDFFVSPSQLHPCPVLSLFCPLISCVVGGSRTFGPSQFRMGHSSPAETRAEGRRAVHP
jgi:hypothetical protein